MEMRKVVLLFLLGLIFGTGVVSADIVGFWEFDNADNLTSASVGSSLTLVGSQTAMDGFEEGDGAVNIGAGSHYICDHGIAPNGEGSYVNVWSLLVDFKYPGTGWHCFYQTNQNNTNDGDCFVSTSGDLGVSASGYTANTTETEVWYRMVVTVDTVDFYRIYVDGELWLEGSVPGLDGRFTLDPTILFFADENGEDLEMHVSSVAIWDHALTEEEVVAMGTVGGPVNDQARAVSPFNGEQFVQLDAVLEWEPSELAPTGYDVYFGTDPNILNNPKVISDQLVTTYDPTLDYATTYYWRVDVISTTESITVEGSTWSFTSTPQIPVINVAPVDTTVAEGETATMTVVGINIDNYKWYKEGSSTVLSTTDTLSIDNTQLADEGFYYCEVENNATPDVIGSVSARLLTERLLGHWPFDGNAEDATGNADGIVKGDPAWVDGIVGSGAIDLSPDENDPNANDYVVLGTADDIVYRTTDFTVAVWVKTAGGAADPAIISNKDWDSGSNTGYAIARESGGTSWQWNIAADGTRRDYDPDLLMEDDQWHHICIAHDRDGVASMYYDGMKTGEVDISALDGKFVDTEFPTVIGTDGAEGAVWPYWFDGAVDDVKIWTYALDGYEIAHEYTDTMTDANICVDRTGLEFDVSGPDGQADCVVDLYDFAKFAETWLNCNRVTGSTSTLMNCK